jgi:hypothetical protein
MRRERNRTWLFITMMMLIYVVTKQILYRENTPILDHDYVSLKSIQRALHICPLLIITMQDKIILYWVIHKLNENRFIFMTKL